MWKKRCDACKKKSAWCNRKAIFHYKGKLQEVFCPGLNEIKYDYVDSKEHFYLQYHVIATENRHETTLQKTNDHTRSQGRGQRGTAPPKFLENTVLLCIERRFSNQNSVIRLKSNILPPQHFWAGYATANDPSSNGVPRVYRAWVQPQFKRSQPVGGSIK